MAANGCETNTNTSVSNCGQCGSACTVGANATATCALGQCGLQCSTDFSNCDTMLGNGCEADLRTPATCGTCSNACPAAGPNQTATCSGSPRSCDTTCQTGFADCTSAPGCESSLNANATCGSCSNSCSGGSTCAAQSCSFCTLPLVGTLAPNSSVSGALDGGAGSLLAGCSTLTTGAENIWSFTLPTTQTVTLQTLAAPNALPDGGSVAIDTVLYVRRACADGATEVACRDQGLPLGNLSRFSLLMDAGTYFVVVDQFGSIPVGGPYGLQADAVNPAPNASCASATPLTAGVPVTNETTAAGGPTSTACQTSDTGPQKFYAYTIPPATRATLTVTPTGTSPVSVVARALSSCSAATCLSSVSGGTTARTVTVENRSATATQSVIFSVSAASSGTDGTFDISVANTALTIAANADCTTPTVLAVAPPLPDGGTIDGGTVAGETIQAGGGALTAACAPSQAGPSRFYSVVVPAGTAVNVAAATTGFNIGVRAFNTCAQTATSCTAFADNTSSSTTETLRLNNPGTTDQSYVVAVSASTLTTTGTYSVSAVVTTPPPAANASCSAPTLLTAGTPVSGERSDLGGLPLTQCLPGQTGFVRYYTVPVPAGSTLQAVVTSNGANNAVRLLDSCGATTCAASSDITTGTTATSFESVLFSNTTTAPVSPIIAVSSVNTGATATQTFTVNAVINPTAANARCAAPTALTVGTPITGEPIATGSTAPAGCLTTAVGPTRYYSVTLAPNAGTVVTASPNGFNANLRVLSSCTATTCVSSSDVSTSTTGAEAVTVRNTGATPQTFIIAVGSVAGTTSGTFDVVALPYFSYARSVIMPTACDDMTAGTSLPSAVGDDVASALVSLPSGFAFSFFGAPVTSFSVTSNGIMQVYPGATGTPTTTGTNTSIPSTGTPNGYIAPFWDDLNSLTGAMPPTSVSYAAFGTAPNRRFTVQWQNFTVYQGASEALTFQAQLNETSNVIEFHYCTMTPGAGQASIDRTSGSSATVGLEDLTGGSGVQSSFNTVNSVSTMNAVRFTPAP
ncbi:MAG: hypothetical protein INH41_24880 [Myxococcaceae bacterium]|nr:hypothetical protein [Myxococcaceae bacterium]MCA3015636.1 hypothetical protein [Myxococcaceae bacterium]